MSRFIRRHFVVLAGLAVLTAVGLNLAAPFWKLGTAAPQTSQTSQATAALEKAFPGTGTDNVGYVVLEGDRILDDAAIKQVSAVADRLRMEPEAVGAVLDLSADPLTAPIGQSSDRRTAYLRVWLKGSVGSEDGDRSLAAVRNVVEAVPDTTDLRVAFAGPAADAADSDARALPWVLGGVIVAMVVATLIATGSAPLSAVTLLTALLALTIAIPIESLAGPRWGGQPGVSSVAWTISLTIAAALYSTLMLARTRRGTPTIAASVAVVAGPLIAAKAAGIVELRDLGLAAGIGVLVAAVLALIFAQAWAPVFESRRVRPLVAPPPSFRVLAPAFRRPWGALAATAAIVLAGLVAIQTVHIGSASAPFDDDRLSPQTVLIESSRDLRTPAGLIAVDRITRRLLEIPGVELVQSGSAPGGLPWADASLAHQFGDLNRQLQSQGVSALPLTDSLDQLPATLDQLRASLDQFDRVINTSTSALGPAGASLNEIVTSLDGIDSTVSSVSRYADPLRQWISTVPNCPADVVCSAASKVVDPLDSVVAQTSAIVATSKALPGNIATASDALRSTRTTLADTRRALDGIRPLLSDVAGTAGDVTPQLTRVTAFVNSLTNDLSANGVGGFYLPQQAIDAPSYAAVKSALFSEDGHATRLFVYGTADAVIADSIMPSIEETTKFGALKDSSAFTVGPSSDAADIEARWLPDLRDLLLLGGLVIAGVGALALRSLALGLLVAVTTIVCYLAALGLFALLWCGALGNQLQWWTPHVAFVVAAAVIAFDALGIAGRFAAPRRATPQAGSRVAFLAAGVVWVGATAAASAAGGHLNQASCLAALAILIGYVVLRTGAIAAAALTARTRRPIRAASRA